MREKTGWLSALWLGYLGNGWRVLLTKGGRHKEEWERERARRVAV